jgi:predicted RNA binding protein with dsRBD fold (UPF0201 family)
VREVTPYQWAMWLGDMPMPEGATRDMMMAAVEAIDEMERRDEAIEGITTFSEFLKRDKQRLKEAEEWQDTEKMETLKSIIKTEKEIINTYRSWLQ